MISCMSNIANIEPDAPQPLLVTASGDPLPTRSYMMTPIQTGQLQAVHEFIIVDSLVTPVILGNNFSTGNWPWFLKLTDNNLFQHQTSKKSPKLFRAGFMKANIGGWMQDKEQCLCHSGSRRARVRCSIPWFSDTEMYDIPKCEHDSLYQKLSTCSQICSAQNQER